MSDYVIDKEDSEFFTNHRARILSGEAWMWCSDCGSKLYSFDGIADSASKCPYEKKTPTGIECVPPL